MKSLRCTEWDKKANGPRNSHFQRSCESIGIEKETEKETSQREEDSEGELSQKVREEKEKTKAYTL